MATTDKQEKTSKRRLRASTESIRQKAVAQETSTPKTKGARSFIGGFFWPLRMVGRGIGKLGKFKIFRFLGLVLLPRYFRNSWKELRQVTWPTRRQSWQLTGAVIIFAVIFGGIVAGVDFGLDKAFKEILLK